MKIAYHVGAHDGGYAYRLDDVWSETFADHDAAFEAAIAVATRQHLEGQDVDITYQAADGGWKTEHIDGRDRPEAAVIDDV
jgi:hypothetical protein